MSKHHERTIPNLSGILRSFDIVHDPARARYGVLGAVGNNHAASYDILCGAKTRRGGQCRLKAFAGKRRCKFHGGMSTGPKTREGRARIAEAQRRRWAKRRATEN